MSLQKLFITLLLAIPLVLASATFHCETSVDAFDPDQPVRQVGTFNPGSDLELGEVRKEDGMVPVTYRNADGTEIQALCRAQDVGLGAPVATTPPSAPVSSETPTLPPPKQTTPAKTKVEDLAEGLKLAEENHKMLFVKYGRAACGNCQALGRMIKSGQVKLPPNDFIFAEINCDDATQRSLFKEKFKVDGQTLPFVVIAGSDGHQLAARTGYGEAQEFKKLIDEAKKKSKSAS